ncbi:MAG: N-acyl homoserine lactonase family protein [Burkholderiales bacterium]|nr:N-acyl homoserine lactonase family protein [Burkholderiales bacterium]
MPMDYFIWLVRNAERSIVVDTGFNAAMAKKRARTLLRTPAEGLSMLGLAAKDVTEIVISHMHYDHVGTFDEFPNARFHLQDTEMAYATGRNMGYRQFAHSYEPDEVCGMVRLVFNGRVNFIDGEASIAPGISLHRIGGHSHGMQCMRVWTQRGWVVLASDSSHYYEHFEKYRVFPTTFNLGEVMKGYETLRRLADSLQHIVPGHDPLVMQRYAAPGRELDGIAVRLDLPPRQ